MPLRDRFDGSRSRHNKLQSRSALARCLLASRKNVKDIVVCAQGGFVRRLT